MRGLCSNVEKLENLSGVLILAPKINVPVILQIHRKQLAYPHLLLGVAQGEIFRESP